MSDSIILLAFNEYFEMVPAVSDQLKNEAYKLRYQVYCIETGFEKIGIILMELNLTNMIIIRSIILSGIVSLKFMQLHASDPSDVINRDKLFPIEKYTQIDNFEVLKNIPRDNLLKLPGFVYRKSLKEEKTN